MKNNDLFLLLLVVVIVYQLKKAAPAHVYDNPQPGDPNFVGPVLGPGSEAFVGPVYQPSPADPDPYRALTGS